MTEVTFYVISQSEASDQLFMACRVVDRAIRDGRRIYVHTDGEEQSVRLDELLWEFRPDSFLPHAIASTAVDGDVPVMIGHCDEYDGPFDVMVNLAEDIPAFHDRFERIAEIIRNEESARAVGRGHWQFYKRRGCTLAKHDL